MRRPRLAPAACLLLAAAVARAEPAEPGPAEAAPAAAPPAAAPERTAATEGNVVLVPYGLSYTRAGLGAGLWRRVPLVRRPGVLWDSTNVAFGVSDFFGFVNNSVGPFVEVTPIAVLKLKVYAGWDTLFGAGFGDALRGLSAKGGERYANRRFGPGDPAMLGWEDGYDAYDNWRDNVFGQGLRLQVMPTLQAKVGPVALQYNFTADWNWYFGGGLGAGDVFHDTFTFTLRKMKDFGTFHEVVLVCDVPVPKALMAGVSAKYYRTSGTQLESLSLVAMGLWTMPFRLFGERVTPWAAVQAGTLLIDPMYRHAFSWVLAVGGDFRL